MDSYINSVISLHENAFKAEDEFNGVSLLNSSIISLEEVNNIDLSSDENLSSSIIITNNQETKQESATLIKPINMLMSIIHNQLAKDRIPSLIMELFTFCDEHGIKYGILKKTLTIAAYGLLHHHLILYSISEILINKFMEERMRKYINNPITDIKCTINFYKHNTNDSELIASIKIPRNSYLIKGNIFTKINDYLGIYEICEIKNHNTGEIINMNDINSYNIDYDAYIIDKSSVIIENLSINNKYYNNSSINSSYSIFQPISSYYNSWCSIQ